MFQQEILLKIKFLLTSPLEREGFVLVDLRFYKRQGGESVLEVLADLQKKKRAASFVCETCRFLLRKEGVKRCVRYGLRS